MTMEELAKGINENYRHWATEHVAELDRVNRMPEVGECIVELISDSARHPLSTVGNPAMAVKAAIKLSSTANFRLGLLVGLLLWKPEEVEVPLVMQAEA